MSLERIIMHWTAGADGVNDIERKAYHYIVGRDGTVTAGLYPPEANIDCADGEYAAHTKGLNTGSIGIAVDAMAGAKERPFETGKCPLTWRQIEAMAKLAADLCLRYRIELTGRTVLTHAEVQPVLGKPQSQKWDITWLPDMAGPGDPVAVGDRLRRLISIELSKAVLGAAETPVARPVEATAPAPAPSAPETPQPASTGLLAALVAFLRALAGMLRK